MAAVWLRDCAPTDRPLLLRIYASTRVDELAAVAWSEEELDAFLAMQFDTQDRSYRNEFVGARFSVILSGQRPVGRISVHRDQEKMTLIDIAILSEFRGQGIGSQVLASVIQEAEEHCLPIRCHVDPLNAAQRLYQRLGFVAIGQDGHLVAMERPCVILHP
jgi:ribosomal protein S18 acetylase RimI-like enzyme